MGKRLDGTSMFTGINAGLMNSFTMLNGMYEDGVTIENLAEAFTKPGLANNAYGATFSSYLTNNFGTIDKNADGKITADEIQNLMSQMAAQGLTREQIISLGGASGLSGSLQETVLSHFDDIDKNHDGKVTNQEIQAYGVDSELEKQKVADRNRIVNNMSMFYDTGADYEGSMLDYRYLDEDEG